MCERDVAVTQPFPILKQTKPFTALTFNVRDEQL